MPREIRRLCAIMVVVSSLCVVCQARQLAVVVNKTNTQSGITAADLLKVFKFDLDLGVSLLCLDFSFAFSFREEGRALEIDSRRLWPPQNRR